VREKPDFARNKAKGVSGPERTLTTEVSAAALPRQSGHWRIHQHIGGLNVGHSAQVLLLQTCKSWQSHLPLGGSLIDTRRSLGLPLV
jgi:hypothetical protein